MNSNCPKCESKMEEGYVLDSIATQTKPETWVEGEKPHSVWEALTTGNGDKRRFETKVYRCRSCGFLESYAVEEQ